MRRGRMKVNQILQGDCLEELKKLPDNSVDAIVTDPPAGIGFMGRTWDSDKGGRVQWIDWLTEVMKEGLRVLKPGGHAFVWALPRTSHWTGFALENAGFEVRDCVYHIFGSGFPKSLSIGKAVDKLQGNEREVVDKKPIGYAGLKRNANLTDDNWKGITAEDTGLEVTKGTSEWEGWGTALKPAVECWWLVRKPLSEKTVAKNVLKWGTGGINIDGCRVGTETTKTTIKDLSQAHGNQFGKAGITYPTQGYKENPPGRFPSHLIHDGSPEVVAGFPNDSARFFYTAKPSKAERDRGLGGLPDIDADDIDQQRGKATAHNICPNHHITNCPCGWKASPRKNSHPTVKALALMEYLIKLITPPKGIVLDMFAGSGSTLVAAKQLQHPFIGIELDKDYCEIARRRVDAVPERLI